MTIYYSDSAKGFFDTKLKGVILPDDAVEITPEERQTLLEQEKQGREIALGRNGRPETRPKQRTRDEDVFFLRASVISHIENQAKSEGFDSILDAVSYADEPTDPTRQAKGQALRAWRSQCWVVFDAETQSTPLPNPQQLIARLPNYT